MELMLILALMILIPTLITVLILWRASKTAPIMTWEQAMLEAPIYIQLHPSYDLMVPSYVPADIMELPHLHPNADGN